MSRITYKAEAEVRDVAAKLRRYLIPSDVIHLDTGWFETDWQSDYQFSTTRFTSPRAMIADLGKMGFHISLWQYTYFTRKNKIWSELLEGGYAVRDEGGRIAPEDATLDFSNPEAVRWYQSKLKSLLDMGVGVIKADFGEGAPLTGLYASGRTGWFEHNLYPVRYNKAAWEITKRAAGDGFREHQFGHGRDPPRRAVIRPVWLHLLESRCRGLRQPGAPRAVPAVAPLRCAHLTHAHTRGSPSGAVGIRLGVRAGLPSGGRDEVPPDALHLRAGQGVVGAWVSHAAHPVLRIP